MDELGALDPFFRTVQEGFSGIADGDNFFDLLADGIVFECVITVPGYPRRVVGRPAVAELYRPYGKPSCSADASTSPSITTESPAWVGWPPRA